MQFDLMRTTASFLAQKIAEYQMEDGQPTGMNPPAGAYRTTDGWLVFTLVKNEHFARLMTAIGRPELANDPRYAGFDERRTHADELVAMMTDLMAQRSTAEWSALLREHDVLNNPINSVGDLLGDTHVRGIGAVGRIEQADSGPVEIPIVPGTTFDPSLVAPAVGEHGAPILSELGMAPDEIEALAACGAVILPG